MNEAFPIRPLHIHVSTTVPVEDLHEDDNELPGVYLMEVDARLPDGLAAWAALQAYYEKRSAEEADDFDVKVFDPNSKQYMEQVEPTEAETILYRYGEKLSHELPKVTLRLTLDVTYSPGGVDTQQLQNMLESMVEYAIGRGGLTGETPAEVENRKVTVTEIGDALDAQAIEPVASVKQSQFQDKEFVLWLQPGTSPEDELKRFYEPIDAADSATAEQQALDMMCEMQVIAVFERVK